MEDKQSDQVFHEGFFHFQIQGKRRSSALFSALFYAFGLHDIKGRIKILIAKKLITNEIVRPFYQTPSGWPIRYEQTWTKNFWRVLNSISEVVVSPFQGYDLMFTRIFYHTITPSQ